MTAEKPLNPGHHQYDIAFPEEEYSVLRGTLNIINHACGEKTDISGFVMRGLHGVRVKTAVLCEGKTGQELLENPIPLHWLLDEDNPISPADRGCGRRIITPFVLTDLGNKVVEAIAELTQSSIRDVIRVSGMFAVRKAQEDPSWPQQVDYYRRAQELEWKELLVRIGEPKQFPAAT